MSIEKPFHRNYRPLVEAPNSGYSSWKYIADHNYAENPTQYTRAFCMIQSDLQKIFEYIEPADINLQTYSHRIHQLLVRTCIEVEANFKAILSENIYSKSGDLNRNDYKIINVTHHLSGYKIKMPYWTGSKNCFEPFKNWGNNDGSGKLSWYDAYNDTKHDRNKNFKESSFENLLNAVSALLIILTSQFGSYNFEPGNIVLSTGEKGYFKGNFGIGSYMMITEPSDWTEDEKYNFDWTTLSQQSDRFSKINYDEIKNQVEKKKSIE